MDRLKQADEAAAAVATAPRVRLKDIEDAIGAKEFHTHQKILTICIVTLKNGFFVVGSSAPASPANFDAELGKKFAYEDCIRQIWRLMGFALKDRLWQEGQ